MLVGRESDEEGPCCKISPTTPAGTDEFESPKLGGRACTWPLLYIYSPILKHVDLNQQPIFRTEGQEKMVP